MSREARPPTRRFVLFRAYNEARSVAPRPSGIFDVGSLVCMWKACIVLCMPVFLLLASPAADSQTELLRWRSCLILLSRVLICGRSTSNILERPANTTWKRMTNMQAAGGRVTEALPCMFLEQIGDHQKLWNLLTAYELWSGHLLTSPGLVFVRDGLSFVLEPGWEVQLQEYRNGFVEKVRARRENSPGGQRATQFGKSGAKPLVDSFATEPSQATNDQHLADPERGQLNLEGAAEVVNQAKVLSKKNMKMWRKRPGSPKYVRHFLRLISELAEEHDGAVEFGPVEVKIWEVLLKCDEKGKKHLKDEEKIRRSQEKERKKKEKRRARKTSERERNTKKKKSSRSGKWSDSSSDSSSTSDSSSRTGSDDSCDTDSSSSGDHKDRRGGGAERQSRPSQFEFRGINGKKHFRMRNGQWQDCSGPPGTECRYCGKRHWAF